MSEIKKILFAAGGTGGHVFPAIAVADAIQSIAPDIEIAFVGALHGNEKTWVEKAGYRFILLDLDFLKGASLGRKIRNLMALPGVAKKAKTILLQEKPDLVIGSGGYVSGPLVAVAAWRKIPTAILEQNAIPGLTNRILSRYVDKIFISFEHTTKLPKKKCIYLGNPVRSKVLATADLALDETWQTSCLGETQPLDGIHVLIFGGSQGAMKLNTDVPVALSQLSDEHRRRICVWHQAGRGKVEATKDSYKQHNITAQITEFIDDMGSAYRWADLIICRAGATSIAEIKASGRGSILVPFPFAAHNHQEKNADAQVAIGASIKVLNDAVSSQLSEVMTDLLDHPEKLLAMAHAALSDAKPDAAFEIAKHCLERS